MRRTHAFLQKYSIPLATNQIEFSLLRCNPDRNGLLVACQELGVTPIAYSPLARGMLSGKYSATNLPKGYRMVGKYLGHDNAPLLNKLREIGEYYDCTPAQVFLEKYVFYSLNKGSFKLDYLQRSCSDCRY